jgi:hypothetical protein
MWEVIKARVVGKVIRDELKLIYNWGQVFFGKGWINLIYLKMQL